MSADDRLLRTNKQLDDGGLVDAKGSQLEIIPWSSLNLEALLLLRSESFVGHRERESTTVDDSVSKT